MGRNDIQIRAEVDLGDGTRLNLNQVVAEVDLDEIAPERGPIVEPWDLVQIEQRRERRRRLVDYIAAQFAHSLTEAIFKRVR